MDKVLGIGNALVDVLVKIEDDTILERMNMPRGSMQLINEDALSAIKNMLSAMHTEMATGGSAGNAIKAIANMGCQPGFIGTVGNDQYGEFFRQTFANLGTDLKLCITDDRPTGIASTFISADSERTFATYLGAAACINPESITPELMHGYRYLFIEGYLVPCEELIVKIMQTAKEAGLVVCLDLASYNIVEANRALFRSLVKEYVDIVFANEEESRAFSGCEPRQALDDIAGMTDIAVVKLGGEGAMIRRGDEVVSVDAIKVDRVLDTTGAGDYFAGGFLYALSAGGSLRECAHAGTVFAGNVIQHIGTTLPDSTWQSIRESIAIH